MLHGGITLREVLWRDTRCIFRLFVMQIFFSMLVIMPISRRLILAMWVSFCLCGWLVGCLGFVVVVVVVVLPPKCTDVLTEVLDYINSKVSAVTCC